MRYFSSLLGVAILVLSVGLLAIVPALSSALPFAALIAAVILAPLAAQIRASSVVAYARTRAFRFRILEREPEILLT